MNASPWFLEYDVNGLAASPVTDIDPISIRNTLQRLESDSTFCCSLFNSITNNCLFCRGERNKIIVVFAGTLPSNNVANNSKPAFYVFARKKEKIGPTVAVQWQADPQVFVDVSTRAVLNADEAADLLWTYFSDETFCQQFELHPKPANGYVV